MKPTYTPKVKKIAEQVRDLTTGELLALTEALKGVWSPPPPPDIGVREPRKPSPLSGGTATDPEEDE